jgi:hypothetical protein
MYFSQPEIVSFWDALAPYWNRRPGLLKKPFAKPFVDQREFLALLKQWAEDVRNGRRVVDVALFDSGALPGPEHETLAACERHIAERWTKDWYLYIADGVQQYQGDIWERAVELITPAIRSEGGLPSGGLMLDLFFGHYQSTPSGIHLDSSDNLAFVTRGPKRMLFWPLDRFAARFSSPPKVPSHQLSLTGRYAEHMSDAIVIDADEGDVIYWPKEYWHIGASDDNWSGMVTLPMWWTARPSALARSMLAGLLDLQGDLPQRYAVNVDDLASAALDFPASIQDVISQVKAQVNARLDLTGQVGWAKFVTAYGFMTPPARLGAPPVIDTTRVRVRHPIVCVPLGRAVAVVGCGHSTLTRCTELSAVVQHLRIGSEHTVSDLGQLVAAHDGDAHQHLLKLVGELVSCRALEVL